MASKSEVPKGLKVIVISMGVLLIGGFFAVVGLVATGLSRHTNEASDGLASTSCNAQNITLPEGFELQDAYSENGNVTALLANDDGFRLIAIDPCTGRIISDLSLHDGKPAHAKTPVGYSF